MKKYKVITDNLDWTDVPRGTIVETYKSGKLFYTGDGWGIGLEECKKLHPDWFEEVKEITLTHKEVFNGVFTVKTIACVDAGSGYHVVEVEEMDITPDELVIPAAYLDTHLKEDVALKVVRSGNTLMTEGFYIATSIVSGTYLKARKREGKFTKEDMIKFGDYTCAQGIKEARLMIKDSFNDRPIKIVDKPIKEMFDEWLKSKNK